MTIQDDINAAVVTWAQAVQACRAAQDQLAALNSNALAAKESVKSAVGQVIAGQTVDVISLGAALHAANDAYRSAQDNIDSLQAVVDQATSVLATVISTALGIGPDTVLDVLREAMK